MLPDGGECCAGHAAVVEDWHKQRRRIEALETALQKSVELQSHYAKLLNAYDGGQRLQFENTDAWIARLVALDKDAGQMKVQMNFDREMQAALEADGEKLRHLTGEDHGPYFMGEPDPPIERPHRVKMMENALQAIATMDVYTRDGEKPAHEVMRDIARTALIGIPPGTPDDCW
jgi:hypothetical protein